jgi:UDP-N-acetylglucosamine 3-dehydrogenase
MLKLGWIGCGQHSKRDLLVEVSNLQSIEKSAICDLNLELVQHCADRFGFVKYYTDYKAMLEIEELQAIVVVGPPQLHEEVAFYALQKGLHVFCEKPVSLSISQLKNLSELAIKNKCKTQVGHFLRYSPAIGELSKNLMNDSIGKPTAFTGTYHTFGPWEIRNEWGCQSLIETYMFVQGIHLIDLVEHVLGPIKKIKTSHSVSQTNRVSISCIVELKSGIIGTIQMSSSAPSWSTTLNILTDKQVEVLTENGTKYNLRKGPHSENKITQNILFDFNGGYGLNQPSGYLVQLQSFINAIITDQATFPDFQQAYKTACWIEQIIQEN